MDDHREPDPDVLGTRTASATSISDEAGSERRELARGELAGMDLGMRVLSYLIAGVLVYGGLGWVGDHYLGTRFLLPLGIVLGAAGGCYVIVRRYGQVPKEALQARVRRSYRKGSGTLSSTSTTRDRTGTGLDSTRTPNGTRGGAR